MNKRRRWARWLRGKTAVSAPFASPFAFQQQALPKAVLLVRLYYWATLYLVSAYAAALFPNWIAAQPVTPLWPLFWWPWLGQSAAIQLITFLAIVVAGLTAVFPQDKRFRILLCLTLFQFLALMNSFGKINHNLHSWLAVSFLFAFLPHKNWQALTISRRHLFLTAFWGAQVVVLLTYSMAGVLKLYAGVDQLLLGQTSTFHPNAFANQIVNRLLQTRTTSLLGPFIIRFPLLGWPLYLSAVYLETASLIAAFRPALHRFWGISLALFHIGTVLFMGIAFSENVLLLSLLFIFSPFHSPLLSWQTVVLNLPLVGNLLGRLQHRWPQKMLVLDS